MTRQLPLTRLTSLLSLLCCLTLSSIAAQAQPSSTRYADLGDGTVEDVLVGLVWLQDANCFARIATRTYQEAQRSVAALRDGQCDLSDGSRPGDWRMPTWEEWQASADPATQRGNLDIWTLELGNIFYSFAPEFYWSSSISDNAGDFAWGIELRDGSIGEASTGFGAGTRNIWPIKDISQYNSSAPRSAGPRSTRPGSGSPVVQRQSAAQIAAAEEAAAAAEADAAYQNALMAHDQSSTERKNTVKDVMKDIANGYREDDRSWITNASRVGRLNSGANHRTTLGQFTTGNVYELSGECDDGCLDLDLVVFDSNGVEVTFDNQADRSPSVEVIPRSNGSYSYEIRMISCAVEPCEWGLMVAEKPLLNAEALAEKRREVSDELNDLQSDARSEGYERPKRRVGRLVEGEQTIVTFSDKFRSAREYGIVGACDADCADFSIEIVDKRGNVITSDNDSNPSMELRVSKERSYTARVTMDSCNDEPCDFGILVMQNKD
jgi:hypothetical protein